MIKVTYLWSDKPVEFNCSYVRCFVPAFAMQKRGYPVEIVHWDHIIEHKPEAMEAAGRADLLVLQRNVFGPGLPALIEWLGRGKRVVVDLDDAYEFMTTGTGSPSAEFWLDGLVQQPDGKKLRVFPLPFDALRWGVKLAGRVSSPSEVICSDWDKFAKTYFVPNYYDPAFYRRHPVYKEPNMIYIGWGGSAGHVASFTNSGVTEALYQIAKERKDVKIFIIGDDRIQKKILTGLSSSRRASPGWVPGAIWSKLLSFIDIGIVPLYGEYDRRRSFLKSLEFTEMGIPWIGTDMEPNRYIKAGRLVENTTAAWYAALSEYVEHLSEKRAEARENQKLARAYAVDDNVDTLIGIWEKALEGK